jgi:hypothetical protein
VTETEFEQAIVDLAHTFGWKVAAFRPAQTGKGWRTPVKYDGKGFPDLTLVHPVRGVIFRELKVGYRSLEPEQEAWGSALVESGADWAVWRDRDWDAIVAFLTDGRAKVAI